MANHLMSLEVSTKLHQSNCSLFSKVQDRWDDYGSIVLFEFTERFKNRVMFPYYTQIGVKYEQDPGFGGNTERLY